MYTIIVSKSDSESIEETLISLSDCNKPNKYCGTIIVENGPSPSNRELVQSLDSNLDTYYIHVQKGGKTNALNVALRRLDTGLIFFSDDDVRFDPDVLTAYYDAGQQYGPGHFFGGPFDVKYETPPPNWLLDYLPPSAKGCGFDDNAEVDSSFTGFLGFNWGAFVSDLKQAGKFDPRKGPGSSTGSTGDETDMQRRLVEIGTEARYVPGGRFTHLLTEKNCTPSWALRRSFRSGVKDGLNYAKEEHNSVFPPPWLLKANLNQLYGMAANFKREQKYFDYKYYFIYHIGFTKGIYLK